MARSGGGWRMLPKDFGPWQTVYWWFRRFVRRMLFQTIHDVSVILDRGRTGCGTDPTAGIVDSQTIKAPHAKTRGYDAAKKTVGRKRHVLVDTDGRLLMVNLTTADVSDSAGAQLILVRVRKQWPWLQAPFRRRRLRSHQTARQRRLPRLHRRNRPPHRRCSRL
jgi:transposase